MRTGDMVSVTVDSHLASKLKGEVGVIMNDANDDEVKVVFKNHKCVYHEDGSYWISRDELYVIEESFNSAPIDRIIFNGPATIILWKDWTKTVSICSKNDIYDPFIGFCIAFTKKHLGSTSAIKKTLSKTIIDI